MTIENREIRGVNIKQLIQYTGAIVAAALMYFDLKNTSLRNREVIQEFKDANKENSKVLESTLKNLEQQQRLLDLRLTVLETQTKLKP